MMVNVLDLIAEQKSKRAYYASRTAAEDYFVKQKSAIQSIAETQGLAEIKSYFVRELEAGYKRLETAKSDDLHEVQGRVQICREFLDFLTNLLEAPRN